MATDPDYDDEARSDVPPFVSGLIFGRPFGNGEVPDDTGAHCEAPPPFPHRPHLVNVCRRLSRTLPVTARALADGRFTEKHAVVISDETGPLTVELAGQVEDRLIPDARFQTVGQFRAAVRKLVAIMTTPDAAIVKTAVDAWADRTASRPDDHATATDSAPSGSARPAVPASFRCVRQPAQPRAIRPG
jgi:hypothetical protein